VSAPELKQGFVRVGTIQVHHTYGGSGSPPILFIHGIGSSGYIEWRSNLERFARDHRVFAPDLPGFGRSGKPRGLRYGIALFARTTARYLDGRRLKRAIVVGTSMGGRVAIELALRHPEKVEKLVLVNALGFGLPKIQPYYPALLLPRVGEALVRGVGVGLRVAPRSLIKRVAARFTGGAAGDAMSDEYLDDLTEMYASEGYPEAYSRTMRSLADPLALIMSGIADQSGKLAGLGKPILLVWGDKDPLFPVELATRAHARMPGSRLVLIAGAGHTPQAERPDEFNRALAGFIRA
jgi:pimeloyl-ACP methyl ester carboxylesterase